MANKLNLKYDFNALAILEEDCGINIFEGEKLGEKLTSPSKIRDLVWAGLLHEQPSLTRAEAGKLIDLGTIDELVLQIVSAMTASIPDKAKESAKKGRGR